MFPEENTLGSSGKRLLLWGMKKTNRR